MECKTDGAPHAPLKYKCEAWSPNVGRKRARSGPIRAKSSGVGQIQTMRGKFGRTRARLGRFRATPTRVRANIRRVWPKFGPMFSGRCCPCSGLKLGRRRSKFGRFRANVRCSSKLFVFSYIWPEVGGHRPSSAPRLPNSMRIRPNVVQFGQKLACVPRMLTSIFEECRRKELRKIRSDCPGGKGANTHHDACGR